MKASKISITTRIFLFIGAILMAVAIYQPIWRIELDAPQYPEGLMMQIYANKLAGDVEIINGLNHYIGMATLHSENFIEFTVLPYILWGFVVLLALAGIIGNKKFFYTLFALLVIFGIVSMIDFWRWEYDYGHNLNPDAPIQVPGQAYQPPLFGFKKLLNFGAFSVPDIGGLLIVGAGFLMAIGLFIETGLLQRILKRKKKTTIASSIMLLSFLFVSCGKKGPEPIILNKDNCEFCKMTISDGRFGAEIITSKGRVYKFDDISCMLKYQNEQKETSFSSWYAHDYMASNQLIDATTAYYVNAESLRSPMRGDIAAFANKSDAEKIAVENQTQIFDWNRLLAEH
ncbi:MAG: nitrous oxide reductase accessory protein NosL [Flavobacteriales bacterium]|nr:nitrous oxide reductase accessory protein NosL [Flavobacteriales bacterium]